MILWCTKHISFHCEGAGKCIFHSLFMITNWNYVLWFDGSSHRSLVLTLLPCQYIIYWISGAKILLFFDGFPKTPLVLFGRAALITLPHFELIITCFLMRDPFIWSQSCGSLDELAILLTWLTALQCSLSRKLQSVLVWYESFLKSHKKSEKKCWWWWFGRSVTVERL